MSKTKKGIRVSYKFFVSISTSLVAAFFAVFLCPSFTAISSTFANNEPAAQQAVDISVDVQSTIAIRTVDSNTYEQITTVPFSITPTGNGQAEDTEFLAQVDTNSSTGYTLLMSTDYKTDGTTSETDPATDAEYTTALVNTSAHDSIPSISTNVGPDDFYDTEDYQNQWGIGRYWDEIIAGSNYSSGAEQEFFLPVPSHDANITLRDDVDTAVSSSYTTIIVGAKVNTEKTSGHYRNKLVLTALANPEPLTPDCGAYKVCYDPNADGVSGTMNDQTEIYYNSRSAYYQDDITPISSSTTEFTLYSPNFVRPGYGFAGWNTKANGRGVMFGPSETLIASESTQSVDQGGSLPVTLTSALRAKLSSEGLTLYAQWIPSAGDMQNWSGCSSMNIGDITALTDNRADSINPNKTYAVAKLADGNCWMVENLRYTDGATTTTTEWIWDNTLKQYKFENITEPDSNSSPIGVSSTDDQEGIYRWFSYGALYSWAAAINSTASYGGDESAPAPGICPAGWRLPTSSSSNNSYDLPKLGIAMMGKTYSYEFADASLWRKYPYNVVPAGYYAGTDTQGRGMYARYWTANSYRYAVDANSFYLRPDYIDVSSNEYKTYAFAVRCMTNSWDDALI